MTPSGSAVPLLDQQLCFALYSASRALTAQYRTVLDPLGVTYPQYLALLALWERDSVAVSELGDRLQLDSGTLSPLLRRMEKAGLIHRTRSLDDERSVRVTLTTRGSALRTLALDIPEAVGAATGLGPQARDGLREQISAVAARLRATP